MESPEIISTLQQRHVLFPHCQVENGSLSLHIRASSVLLEHCSDPNQSETECYIGATSSQFLQLKNLNLVVETSLYAMCVCDCAKLRLCNNIT